MQIFRLFRTLRTHSIALNNHIIREHCMSKLKDFLISTPRPLPVIILADVSGSMSVDAKIDVLNDSIEEMIRTFAVVEDSRAEIQVTIITFGKGGAKIHQSLTPANQMTWQKMTAAGNTPLGEALVLAEKMLQDHQIIPSRAYIPTIILVSDGKPTDDWQNPLMSLLTSSRASKAARFALGVGDDADIPMLSAFLADPNAKVFATQEVRQIKNFFRWVTMSVTSRTRSINPDSIVQAELTDLDDFEY